MRKVLGTLSTLAAALAIGACTIHQPEVPPVAGPSVLALSITPLAIPDSISQDGASQSSIQVTVLDANSRPIPGVTLRADMSIGGVVQDFGTLSARTIV